MVPKRGQIMTYTELREAVAVFGLGKCATMEEIRARHKEMVKRHHPDAGGEETEVIKKINMAYHVLQEYIGNYHYSFLEEEFFRQHPEERTRKQFKNDHLWD
jgi:DnaJ-class molecular chaperone